VLLAGCIASFIFLWLALNLLDWLSLLRHGGIGAGGGFSIALIGGAFASLLCCLLVSATFRTQRREATQFIRGWPIARQHLTALWACLGLLVVASVWIVL